MQNTRKNLFLLGLAVSTLITTSSSFAVITKSATQVQPYWVVSPFVLKSSDLGNGGTTAYRPWFENGAWQGDVIEYNISADGTRTTDASYQTIPPTNGTNNWSARASFHSNESLITDYWKATTGRKIITHDGTSQIGFRWDELTTAQQQALDPQTADAGSTGSFDSPILNFIRGDRSSEFPNGSYRTRSSLLGDIQNAGLVFVGAPDSDYQLPGYADYAIANASRGDRVYASANDGMVHVFDGETGSESYAYVPSMILEELPGLADKPYTHQYFVDGQLATGDAKKGSNWMTVVSGGLGDGGVGFFALDATNENLSEETSVASSDQKILFELAQEDSGIGHIYGRPRIAKLPDGNWYVLTGNGYFSADDKAELYMVNLSNNTVSSIDTLSSGNNGLSAPSLVDTDGDFDADYAYAGDKRGNLWKFNLTTKTSQLLFAAGTSKPITTAPEIAAHPSGGYLVYFGTGSMLSEADALNTDTQTIYAIWDKPNSTAQVDASELVTQELTIDSSAAIATDNAVDWSSKNGWLVDLPGDGERLIGNPKLRGGRLQFVSHSSNKNSWAIELHWLTGGDFGNPVFDLNDDGQLNALDTISVDSEARTPVGIFLGQGNFSQPTFARVGNGHDVALINGLKLPIVSVCSGDCSGGLEGGHADVDTDVNLGGATDVHKHEYDNAYSVTYIDYLNLQPPSGGSMQDLDEIGLLPEKEFVAVIANADFSPGGTITIGIKSWNVVDYQVMVQQALQSWDGVSPLIDQDGDPLTYSLNQISAVSGTMRLSFDGRAIADGGLHPVSSGCVKSELLVTNDRWRNGSLVIQLLDKSLLLPGASANNIWEAQFPPDLQGGITHGGLRANPLNSAGFIYENSVFWHYGGECYGDPDWAADVAAVRHEILVNQMIDLFPAYESNIDEVDAWLEQLENYTCSAGTGAQCANEVGFRSIESDLNAVLGDYKTFAHIMNGTGGLLSDGVPSEILEFNVDQNPSIGPDYTLGRHTWIDLTE